METAPGAERTGEEYFKDLSDDDLQRVINFAGWEGDDPETYEHYSQELAGRHDQEVREHEDKGHSVH